MDKLNFILPEPLSLNSVEEVKLTFTRDFLTTTLPTEFFQTFPHLKKLTFQANSVNYILDTDFVQARHLEELDLSHNHLERVQSRVFATVSNLTSIDFGYNSIYNIQDSAFAGLLNLTFLSLRNNQLTKIGRWTFANLPSLETLHLGVNSIEEIEEGALNLPKLTSLNLYSNKLKSLDDSLFLQTPQLRTLWVNSNNIQTISNSLTCLHQLEDLKLGGNKIVDLSLQKLLKLPNLLWVNLKSSGFNLDSASNCDIAAPINATENGNSTVSKVKGLDLSKNDMKDGVIFEKLKIFPNLEQIILKNNSLTTMDLDTIQTGIFPKLRYIDIFGNNFDQQWLVETTRNLSMTLENMKWYEWTIKVKSLDDDKEQCICP